MRIAVVGGTGAVGQHVVAALRAQGDDPVVLTRAQGVDVVTGSGLDAALEGADAVIDVSNIVTTKAAVAMEFFTTATTTLGAAAARAGVGRLVVLSIVGADRVATFGYYAAKLRQEALVAEGPVPATVLRATAFHEFAGQMLERAKLGPVSVVPKMRIRPVAASVVGEHLALLARSGAPGRAQDLAGPEPESLTDMARAWARAVGRRRMVIGLTLPGDAGKSLAGGALMPGTDVEIAGPDFATWLAAQHP